MLPGIPPRWRLGLRSVGACCAFLLVLGWGAGAIAQSTEAEERRAEEAYRRLTRLVSPAEIADVYRTGAGFGSRLAGSPGERRALEYAEQRFRALGLVNIRREPFTVTVPDPEATGRLRTPMGEVTLYPLWPNLVRTSTCDVSGPMVYAGRGSLEELDGKTIEGALVVLEFDSGVNWKNAASLGASAILFLEPDTMTRAEAERKFLNVPIRTPRFYVRRRDFAPVLAAARDGQVARLVCRQDWVVRETYNLIAELPGNDPALRNERVVLKGYIDAMSAIPALAPGGEALGNLALLLESARIWQQEPHRRPIEFVVSTAHGLALQGAREYVHRRLEDDPRPQILTLTLDITGGSRALGSYAQSYFIEHRPEAMDPVRNLSRTLRQHAEILARVEGVGNPRLVVTDAVNSSDNRTWKNNIPGRFALDCEPFTMGGYNALTLATIEDARDRADTPADTVDRVNQANVVRQARALTAMLWHILNDPTEARGDSRFRVALRVKTPRRMSLTGGFSTVEGRVVLFDPDKSFLPDVPVPGALALKVGRLPTFMGVRGNILAMTEGEEARYRLIGLTPISAYYSWQRNPIEITAFRLDPSTGEIDHAVQYGSFAGGDYDTYFLLKTAYKATPLVVFPCVATDLYELIDPRRMVAQESFTVLDARDDGPPQNYGLFKSWKGLMTSDVEDTAVLFTPMNLRWKLLMASDFTYSLILLNATEEIPNGFGYLPPGGDPAEALVGRAGITKRGYMPNLPLQVARDVTILNQFRIERFAKYRIVSPGIDTLQTQARAEIELAEEAEARQEWSAAKRHARAAWGLALRAHPVLQKTAGDVVNGVLFYLFLLIPFSYFLERLLFGNRLLVRQLLVSIAIFIAAFLLLRAIHPAFEIVENPAMIFVGFVMGVLSIIVIAFVLGKFESSLKTLKQIESGVHEVDIGRASVAMAAFNLGIGNMRRRRARTFLTTLTLVVMTFIVLSFTSIVPELAFNEVPTDVEGRYAGVLVRNPGLEPLEMSTHRILANEFRGEATVVRRLWYYGADIRDQGNLTLTRGDRAFDARALVGMDPEEVRVSRLDEALLPGGRWFVPGESNVVILPQPMADQLKISPNDVGSAQVVFAGAIYTVIGLLDSGWLRQVIDLDGESILPADFTLSNQLQTETLSGRDEFREFIRLEPATVFFVPAERALALGADVRTVAIGFADPDQTRESLRTLMPRLTMNLYASVPVEDDRLQVRRFSAFHRAKGTGLGLVLIQMLIAAVFVFNTMVASVFERRREISIFSSIGLAPNHIASLFFAESMVYGVLGAVFGYFSAQIAAKVIVATGALPGLYLNFSSTSAVLSAAIVTAVVMLSTIYPARVASRIAAPALNESMWETEPEGDHWSLQLPFSLSSTEARPIVEFLGEWFAAYEEYTIGSFVTAETGFVRQSSTYGEAIGVETTAWVAPYDLGVSQRLRLLAVPTDRAEVAEVHLEITRLSGEPENWVNVNKRFLANLRKQFLTWRSLDAEQRAKYVERARERYAPSTVATENDVD